MASRKDELNAFTFARRRTLAAFLRPGPATPDAEDAPRPLRSLLPGMVAGGLILAVFGAWGMFRPSVPEDWDAPGRHVIIGSESTTRYVVLETGGRRQLHPVLNLSSARLLLQDTDELDIVSVDEDELDSGRVPRGPTLGIPYAPDRLPAADEAAEPKRWTVCQQPGAGGAADVRQAAFVLAERDAGRVEGAGRLSGGEVLYVRSTGPDGAEYLVDGGGTKYRFAGDTPAEADLLRRLLTRGGAPQPVGEDWLATFADGTELDFPELPAGVGTPAQVPGLRPEAALIGTVLEAPSGNGTQHYLVLPGRVVPVTPFTAYLIANSPATAPLGQAGEPLPVGAQDFVPSPPGDDSLAAADWPTARVAQVNHGRTDTVCSVLLSVDGDTGRAEVTAWAGADTPATTASGSASAYVTPGSGLLYRQVQGEQAASGSVFLVTDTGLRYAVQDTGGDGEDGGGEGQARTRLGYGEVTPVPVPAQWSQFLPAGPRLNTTGARQPQGS